MTLEFLSPAPDGATASSPLEPWTAAAGARFEERDGWRVAISFGDPDAEAAARREGVAIADCSALGKLELQAPPATLDAALERLTGADALGDGFLWRSSPDRALAVCEPSARVSLIAQLEQEGATLVDLTAGLAAIELSGPLARDLLERLTALDVRSASLPPGEVRAGAVARVPAALARTGPDEYLMLVASPQAPDVWEMVVDVGAGLGLRPVGEAARARA